MNAGPAMSSLGPESITYVKLVTGLHIGAVTLG
jgi:hypothetical protein